MSAQAISPSRRQRRRFAPTIPLLAAIPAIALLVLLMVVPLCSFVIRSLTGIDGEFSWGSYQEIFTEPRYRTALFNSVWLAIASTALALLIALPAALHLARLRGRTRTVVDAVLTFPLSLPGVVIGFFIIVMFGRSGLAQAAMTALTGEPGLVLAYAMPGLLLAYLYFQLPRVLGTLRGAAEALDPDLVTVARTLGASRTRVTFTVVLPALKPAIFAATALAIASSLGAYGTVAALSEGFRVLPLDIAEQGTMLQNTRLAGAMSIVLALVSLISTLLNDAAERHMRRGAKPAAATAVAAATGGRTS
ncbi:ABC transporter permease [Catellatospora methionotrophica]|uniref:ABC transporter permease n=1 Tax=Catellatospora methionotrophica TaxID=121620 RepID=A0A8J3PJ48_9ACTN|nr:ABC transporter permease subunit [Catellatospora methionotrophica]GIG18153.1 ABC transporter permease [Catellatospora methionotrophica]